MPDQPAVLNVLHRLEAGERVQAATLPGPVLVGLAEAGWSVHLLTGELISAPAGVGAKAGNAAP